MFLLAAAIGRWLFKLERRECGIFGLNVAYPNYGYMGIPLAILSFGDAAALPMALILFADTIVLLTLTSFFVANNDGTIHNAGLKIMRTMITNPLVLAVVAGLLFSVTGLPMPSIPAQFGTLLAGAAAPVALFALGATLYGQPLRAAASEISIISSMKLIVHPVLIAVVCWHSGARSAVGQGRHFVGLPAGGGQCVYACQLLWCLYRPVGLSYSGQYGSG